MAARPRKREYRHLPEYLLFDKDRGVYKFTLITGKKKNLGKSGRENPSGRYVFEMHREY